MNAAALIGTKVPYEKTTRFKPMRARALEKKSNIKLGFRIDYNRLFALPPILRLRECEPNNCRMIVNKLKL